MSKRAQRGFTLVELLVVVGIMATLAAVVIPNVGRFVAPARAAADIDELDRVQAAIDMLMAEVSVTAVSPNDVPATPIGATLNDFTTFDFSGGNNLYPQYVRQDPTKCDYNWNATGQITNQACP